MLGLEARHGADRLEKAGARALEVGDPSYRTITGIPAARGASQPEQEVTGDGGAAAHLHGPSRLFGNVVALPSASGPPAADTAATSDAHHRPDPDHDHDQPDAHDGHRHLDHDQHQPLELDRPDHPAEHEEAS